MLRQRDGDRGTVERSLRSGPIRPGAAPVGTFVQPSRGGKLDQLAQGLAAFAPGLERFSETITQGRQAEQRAAGEQAARLLHETGKSYAQAVRSGALEATSNPFFDIGFKEQFGRATAARYEEHLHGRMDEIADAIDQDAFETWEREVRQEFLAEAVGDKRDLSFEAGFGRTVDQSVDRFRNQFAAGVAQRRAGAMREAFSSTVSSLVRARFPGADAPEEVRDAFVAELAEEILADLDMNTEALGLDRTIYNEAAIDAIVNAAADLGPDVLRLLDEIQVGGTSLRDKPGAAEKARIAERQYYSDRDSADRRALNETTQRMAEVKASISHDVLSDPNLPMEDVRSRVAQIYEEFGHTDEATQYVAQTLDLVRGLRSNLSGILEQELIEQQVNVHAGRMSIAAIDSNAVQGMYTHQQYSTLRGAAEARVRSLKETSSRALSIPDVFTHRAFSLGFQELERIMSTPNDLGVMIQDDPALVAAMSEAYDSAWLEVVSSALEQGKSLDNPGDMPFFRAASRRIAGEIRTTGHNNRVAPGDGFSGELRAEPTLTFPSLVNEGRRRAVADIPYAREEILGLVMGSDPAKHRQSLINRFGGRWQSAQHLNDYIDYHTEDFLRRYPNATPPQGRPLNQENR